MAKILKDEDFSDEKHPTFLGISHLNGSDKRTLIETGSDTTSSTLVGFIQAMACFSEVQNKAQDQIDVVIGWDRLPAMADEPRLLYIHAMIKETLR